MQTQPPSQLDAPPVPAGEKIFTVGTLQYTRTGIVVLFFLLLSNDMVMWLMEAVSGLSAYIWKDNHGNNTQMALYGTAFGFLSFWINPVVSTWSDRCRTRWGRRRPFLLIATPPCAFFLGLTPFLPDVAHWLMRWRPVAFWAGGDPAKLVIPLLAFNGFFMGAFNGVILAIFMYYYWDVVPANVLGRFQAMNKAAAAGVGFLFGLWIAPHAQKHMKAVFLGISAFFLVAYTLTILLVKEGEYPPPEPRKSSGFLRGAREAIAGYFRDCFCHPRYLWIFGTFVIIQVGNQVGGLVRPQLFQDQLGMDIGTIYRMGSWSGLVVALLGLSVGYSLGSLIDRLKPMRVVIPLVFLWAMSNFSAFLFLRGPWSLLICSTLVAVTNFFYNVCIAALTVQIFPKEKLGQFCSCNQTLQTIVCWATVPFVGMLWDRLGLGYYHYSFLWPAIFEVLGMIGFAKIYLDWKGSANPARALPST